MINTVSLYSKAIFNAHSLRKDAETMAYLFMSLT